MERVSEFGMCLVMGGFVCEQEEDFEQIALWNREAGVMWSWVQVWVSRRAAEFKMHWS